MTAGSRRSSTRWPGQTRRPDHVVAVDTGSTDTGPALLRDRLGDEAVLTAPATSGYGQAVAAGLAGLPAPGRPADEWVWLLHDDSAPAPDALERLLAAAADQPSVSLLGPKLREWPSLRRLLEVGVTISGTGHRETGLERGEYDQGQHDRVRDVLAVNTAGLLVRRTVLEELGLDHRLPVLGADLDLGWRAARAGHRTVVVPDAVVFHVEATSSGRRRTPVTGEPRRSARAAALYTLLVDGSAAGLPFRAVRLLLGSLLRALGLLLVRAPREAADELAAVASTYLRPGRVLAGRSERRDLGTASVRHLLAPWWLPYRHGLDAVGRPRHRRRPRGRRPLRRPSRPGPGGPRRAAGGARPRSGRRRVAGPVTALFVLLVVAALVAARGLVGSGAAGRWRAAAGARQHAALVAHLPRGPPRPRHRLDAPAGPYLLPLALLGTLLLGKAWLLVDALFLLAVPLAAAGGYRFLLRLTSSRPASLWGAAAYGVLPVVTGAVQQGRLGTVAATLVLPWLAHAALFLDRAADAGPAGPGRLAHRALARGADDFVPSAWPLAVVLAVLAVAAAGPDRTALGRLLLVPLLGTLVLLLPWTVSTWAHHGLGSLLEAGLPVPRLDAPLSRWDVLLGRPGEGAPGWLSAGLLVAALAALVRTDTRPVVLRCWAVVVVALAGTALVAGLAQPAAVARLPARRGPGRRRHRGGRRRQPGSGAGSPVRASPGGSPPAASSCCSPC